VYPLNLLLPAAGNYTITAAYDNSATIFRSNSGVTGYPFKAGNVFSITGNNAVSGTDTTVYKGYYYYFYDMQVKSAGCASTAKEPVILSIPVITQNGTVLSSNFAAGNQWYLEGKIIPGAAGETYTPKQSGNYTVSETLSTGCQSLSANYVYVLASGGQGNNSDIGLVIFPVPTDGPLSVIFAAPADADLTISVISADGHLEYTSQQKVSAGNFSTSLDVSHLPPGNYVLQLLLGKKFYNNKIVIVR
jgi:hypothetical protein